MIIDDDDDDGDGGVKGTRGDKQESTSCAVNSTY